MMDFRAEMERPGPECVVVDGVELRKGSRVRLKPRAGADILDLALAGRVAVVEGIDQDHEEKIYLAVTLEDDPGRDLGEERYPGHRFFFSPDEIEPIESACPEAPPARRILVAGIGNIFLGDDGFGVEVARGLAERELPAGVRVADFGIRGLDLAYALQDGYDAVILVDAAPRGEDPGTLYVIEPDLEPEGEVVPDAHAMDPVRVLRLARALGRVPARTLVVGCEPGTTGERDEGDAVLVELSRPVRGAVGEAVRLVESLLREMVAPEGRSPPPAGEIGEGERKEVVQ